MYREGGPDNEEEGHSETRMSSQSSNISYRAADPSYSLGRTLSILRKKKGVVKVTSIVPSLEVPLEEERRKPVVTGIV